MAYRLFDKLVLLLSCFAMLALAPTGVLLVIPPLLAITLSAFCSYFESAWFTAGVGVFYAGACLYHPVFLAFLPLCYYDYFNDCKWPIWLLPIAPFALQFSADTSIFMALCALFCGVAFLLSRRTGNLTKLRQEYLTLRDDSKELALHLEGKNKDLLDRQDYEVRLATLDERNRIAREIHDSVGHLLSRSILQVAALRAVSGEESAASLDGLQDTLSQAMDSIRDSVHDLHDDSLDFAMQVHATVDGFAYCPVSLDFDVDGRVERETHYCLIAILKEALNNVMKHSDASHVEITMREHPALYQLVVQDNGRGAVGKNGGIGLENMRQRVQSLGGIIRAEGDTKGFRVFVSIPKEEEGI